MPAASKRFDLTVSVAAPGGATQWACYAALRFAPALAKPMRPIRKASARCSGARSERSATILIPVSGSVPRLMRDCLVSARSLARYASISDVNASKAVPFHPPPYDCLVPALGNPE